MTLREFLNGLNKLAESNPEALDLMVISAKDEEGNEFMPVFYKPSIGSYDSREKEFSSIKKLRNGGYLDSEIEVNSVCIN